MPKNQKESSVHNNSEDIDLMGPIDINDFQPKEDEILIQFILGYLGDQQIDSILDPSVGHGGLLSTLTEELNPDYVIGIRHKQTIDQYRSHYINEAYNVLDFVDEQEYEETIKDDEELINTAIEEYFRSFTIPPLFDHPKIEWVIGEAISLIKNFSQKFSLIISGLYGYPSGLIKIPIEGEESDFKISYANLIIFRSCNLLDPNGIGIFLVGSNFMTQPGTNVLLEHSTTFC